MAEGLDGGMVKQHYAGISNQELIRIIKEDGILLTPEAKEIVFHEVQKRNLEPHILPFLNAQLKDYSDTEIDALCEILQKLSCPGCGRSDHLLNMSHIMQAVSFILITNVNRSALIACPDCLDKATRRATIITALLGWWGLPWGIIRTIQALSNNASYRRKHHVHFPNEALQNFVRINAGTISIHKNDSRKLRSIILRRNKQNMDED